MTEIGRSDLPLFVVDAHALWWYMKSSPRLPAAAADIFTMADKGKAVLVVPAIVIAEICYLSVKVGERLPPADLLRVIDESNSLALSDLGRTQLELLDLLMEIPEMHDRLITAEAVALGAPVVTRDPDIAASPQVRAIW